MLRKTYLFIIIASLSIIYVSLLFAGCSRIKVTDSRSAESETTVAVNGRAAVTIPAIEPSPFSEPAPAAMPDTTKIQPSAGTPVSTPESTNTPTPTPSSTPTPSPTQIPSPDQTVTPEPEFTNLPEATSPPDALKEEYKPADGPEAVVARFFDSIDQQNADMFLSCFIKNTRDQMLGNFSKDDLQNIMVTLDETLGDTYGTEWRQKVRIGEIVDGETIGDITYYDVEVVMEGEVDTVKVSNTGSEYYIDNESISPLTGS